MEGLSYLLEANLYLTVFYAFYGLLLRGQTFYSLNRYYLISVVFLSYILPLVQVGYFYELLGWPSAEVVSNGAGSVSREGVDYVIVINALKMCYLAGTGFLAASLVIQIARILNLARKATRHRLEQVTYFDIHDPEIAFSFFNLLFVNPSARDRETILKHEMIHIKQGHSADILLFELLHVLNWFNPVVWLMRKEIKLIHEYIADDISTCGPDIQKYEYAMLLIQNSLGTGHQINQLTNQLFNSSLLKRRINMLNKRKSARRARLRYVLILPVVLGMLFASTVAISKNYGAVDLYPVPFKQALAGKQDTIKPVPPPPPPIEPGVKDQHMSKAEFKKRFPHGLPIKSDSRKHKKKSKNIKRLPPPVVVPAKKALEEVKVEEVKKEK